MVLWTLGIKLTTPGGKGSFDPKKIINPCTVAIVLSVVMVLTGLKLPSLLNTALDKIGATATPLARRGTTPWAASWSLRSAPSSPSRWPVCSCS